MKRYNVVTSKIYTKNGEEKKAWSTVGTLLEFPATDDKDKGFALELYMFPTTKFSVFEQKEKTERVNEEGIPF